MKEKISRRGIRILGGIFLVWWGVAFLVLFVWIGFYGSVKVIEPVLRVLISEGILALLGIALGLLLIKQGVKR